MKISKLIGELQDIQAEHGDIEAVLQDDGAGGSITGYESFFMVVEVYDTSNGTKEKVCNLRWWPY